MILKDTLRRRQVTFLTFPMEYSGLKNKVTRSISSHIHVNTKNQEAGRNPNTISPNFLQTISNHMFDGHFSIQTDDVNFVSNVYPVGTTDYTDFSRMKY